MSDSFVRGEKTCVNVCERACACVPLVCVCHVCCVCVYFRFMEEHPTDPTSPQDPFHERLDSFLGLLLYCAKRGDAARNSTEAPSASAAATASAATTEDSPATPA
jgi:hypothetical protein